MVDHLALSAISAGSGARVYALLVHAGLIQRTFGTDNALGPASRGRPDVTEQARAHGLIVDLPALTIRAARRRTAGSNDGRFCEGT